MYSLPRSIEGWARKEAQKKMAEAGETVRIGSLLAFSGPQLVHARRC